MLAKRVYERQRASKQSSNSSKPTRIKLPKAFKSFTQPARYKVPYGGRGGGKSESIARILIDRAGKEKLLFLGIREIYNSIADSSKALLESVIEEHNLWCDWQATNTSLTNLRTGSRWIFRGLQKQTSKSIKSLKGVNVVWGDEASALSKRSLELLIPTIREPGSEIWLSFNPENEDDPVYEMFVAGEPPPRSIVKLVNLEDNPYFPPDLQEHSDWLRSRDPELWKHVYGGETLQISNQRIYNNWKKESFETPSDASFRGGADWGYSIDPSCLIRIWIRDRTMFIDWEAWQVGCEIVNLPTLFDTVPDSRRFPITADNNKPDTISYLRQNGFVINPSKKGAGSVIEGIDFVRSYDIVVHPRCENIVDEFKRYKFKKDEHSGKIYKIPEDKFNHGMDSLRYATEGVRHAVDSSWLRVLS